MNKTSIIVIIVVVLIALGIAVKSSSAPATIKLENNATTTTMTATSSAQVNDTDMKAQDGDLVSVLYTGKLTNGTVFDASSLHGNKPIEFVLGAGMVIKGWDEGLVGMKIGEKKTMTIPPEKAYGPRSVGDIIPANATLVFDVELVGIKRK